MIKELKYFFYILVTFFFIFFSVKYYFSDVNKKKSFRSYNNIDKKINLKQEKLLILKNNTENIIEYAEKDLSKKKRYFFLDLLKNDN